MNPIDVGKVKISPFDLFDFDSILEIKIVKELNDHSTLYVKGVVKDSKKIVPVTSATEGIKIKCENDGLVYFEGVLQNVKIECEGELYRLEIYAVSNTILLDTVKHKRSFQDNEQTYQQIVTTVIGEGASVKYNADEMKVENIILQYNETDWQFAKRLASHTQDVLIPITSDEPAFHFGTPDPDTDGVNLDTDKYFISRDFDAFRSMSEEEKPLSAEDVTIYTVETDCFLCDIGEKFVLNGNDLRVRGMALSLVNSTFKVVYTLSAKKAVSTPKFYNSSITGLLLDGEVLKVENDNVKLHLAIDKEKPDEGKAHLFVYATGYSAEGHTGWYVMPEKGDTVQLLFPTEDEKYAYAASSVRRDDTERTSDPLVKYLRTPFGKEIKFEEKEILITAKDEKTFIRINEDTGIEIIAPHPILINSGSTIKVQSKDDMTLITDKSLFMQAKKSIEMKGGGSSIKLDNSGVDIKGEEVREN